VKSLIDTRPLFWLWLQVAWILSNVHRGLEQLILYIVNTFPKSKRGWLKLFLFPFKAYVIGGAISFL
jgi:hypothetical protein